MEWRRRTVFPYFRISVFSSFLCELCASVVNSSRHGHPATNAAWKQMKSAMVSVPDWLQSE